MARRRTKAELVPGRLNLLESAVTRPREGGLEGGDGTIGMRGGEAGAAPFYELDPRAPKFVATDDDRLGPILYDGRNGSWGMMFKGDCVQLARLENGFVELSFDRAGAAINKLDDKAVGEFGEAVREIAADASIRGVLVTSAKDVFIVGADITEFGRKFRCSGEEVARDVLASNQIFVRFEDLAVPTVVAINGFALGGGLELALCASRRVMSEAAQVGVPEVKLGLFPGFGGTVRLARVAGQRIAIEWVVSGNPAKAADALQAGVVDAVVAPQKLRAEALAELARCVEGQVDWRAAQQRKREPLGSLDSASYDDALAKLATQAALHQPAAEMAVRMMREAAACDRARALELEATAFGAVTQTQAANAMVQTFVNEQTVRKIARRHAEGARPVSTVGMTDTAWKNVQVHPVGAVVEVVRGSHTTDTEIAQATAYVIAQGKTPIIVKDCPGFLVNRILTPFFIAFCGLLAEGADYVRVDQALEAFGWRIGPAGLQDAGGLDTGARLIDLISAGYPQRMAPPGCNAIRMLAAEGRLGRTSGAGFYDYRAGAGDSERKRSPEAQGLIGLMQPEVCVQRDDAHIVERTMVPLLLEAIRCLEEGVAASAAELDLAMVLGAGFPAYLGGPLKYADWMGLPQLLARCDVLAVCGPMYAPPVLLRQLAASERKFHEVAR